MAPTKKANGNGNGGVTPATAPLPGDQVPATAEQILSQLGIPQAAPEPAVPAAVPAMPAPVMPQAAAAPVPTMTAPATVPTMTAGAPDLSAVVQQMLGGGVPATGNQAVPGVVPGMPPGPAAPMGQQMTQGRQNPLQAIITVMTGSQVTQQDIDLLNQFLGGQIRLSDNQVLAMSSFFLKMAHSNYGRLLSKIIDQMVFESNGAYSYGQLIGQLAQATGVKPANRDPVTGGNDDTYKQYTADQVRDAASKLWDWYGKTGSVSPGLIDRSNARASASRQQA